MKKFISLILILSFVLSLISCKKPPDIEIPDNNVPPEMISIIKDGLSDYQIVYSNNESLAQLKAANELAYYISESLDVILSVVTDESIVYDETKKYISVGNTSLLENANFNFDYSTLNGDGFFIKFKQNLIFIDGLNDRGTLYGAYDFLERYIGVRFLTIETTHIPKLTELKILKKDIVEIPDFLFRNYLNYDATYNPDFGAKMRMANEIMFTSTEDGGESPWYDGHMHNTFLYVDPVLYADKTDWFSADKSEICFSNGIDANGQIDQTMSISVAKVMLESLKEKVAEKPNKEYFMIGQMDEPARPCECSACQANMQKYGGRAGVQIVMINALAREIKEWAKDRYPNRAINLVTFAYNYAAIAPVKYVNNQYEPYHPNVVTEDNVYIRIAPFIYNYGRTIIDPLQDDSLKELYKGWTSMTDNLMVWDYLMNTLDYFWYTPYLGVMKDNYVFYKNNNIIYCMTQPNNNEPNDFQTQIGLYVASKLMWNTKLDAKVIIDEFINLEYGIAHQDVRNFLNYMEDFYAAAFVKYPALKIPPAHELNSVYGSPETYPYEIMLTAKGIVEKAIQKVNDSELSNEEKLSLRKKLTRILLKPQRMLMKFADNYPMTADEKAQLITDFFTNADFVGVQKWSEARDLDSLKAMYGVR